MPEHGASIVLVTVLLALSNLGASLAEVVNDALVAECAKKKKTTGELQSFAWFSTAAGGVLGSLIATLALSRVEYRNIFGIFGTIVLFHIGKSIAFNEGALGLWSPHLLNGTAGTQDQFSSELGLNTEIWASIKSHAHESQGMYTLERSENGYKPAVLKVENSDHLAVDGFSEKVHHRGGMKQQLVDLVWLLQQREIMYPLSWFVASYAMIPTLALTVFFYQTEHLKVDPAVIGIARLIGQLGLMGGSVLYSRYLKNIPMRKLLTYVQVLLFTCMLFDIILVKRLNILIGIPDSVMVLGMSAYVDAINQFKVLPFAILLGQLCPAGKEGALLAAFMSMQCLATIVSGYLGVSLTSALHISAHDFSKLPLGIVIQAFAALIPLFWISFIPAGHKISSSHQTEECKEF
ncbi:hypothetical protein KP509_30G040800 [Ceratopteris richardii]|nr:hypothetical protein KP509_30G040800 [Ceratopteris richardii]